MRTVLSIAGSDCSGGAGIQADLKTMLANGVYGMSVITAVTAQNTLGVKGIWKQSAACLKEQICSVFDDIRPDAVKIGMIGSGEGILEIASLLSEYLAQHIVLDPVMVSTSGTPLLSETDAALLKKKLFPLAELVTPNLPEAEAITGQTIVSPKDMEEAGKRIYEEYGCSVLIKGGHSTGAADDLLCMNGTNIWLQEERIHVMNTHGTGCTLSSAIASNLAKGLELPLAVQRAKEYLTGALRHDPGLGHGNGPLDHGYALVKEEPVCSGKWFI